MANGPEVARAYVTIIPSMKGAQDTIKSELADAAIPAGDKAGKESGESMMKGMEGSLSTKLPDVFSSVGLSSAGELSSGFASGLSKAGIPGLIAGLAIAAGSALYKVGEQFDVMYDKIKIGTGATGDALKELETSAQNIAQQVPSSFDDIGQTVADLNTRLGVTGDTLETLSVQFLEAGEMLGKPLDVSKVTGAFNAFGLSEAEMADAMDDLFTVSQSTGIEIDDMATSLSRNSEALKMLGFSFQEAASMAGLLDKAGIDAEDTFSTINGSLSEIAKVGEKPADSFKRTVEEIDAFIKKGNEAAALNLASEVFGSDGAVKFIGAMKSGALSVDELNAALAENSGAIMNTAGETQSFAESWQMVKNNLLVAIEPLASGIFNVIGEIMKALVPIIQTITDAFQAMNSKTEKSGGLIKVLAGILKSVANVIRAVLLPVARALGEVFGAISTIVSAAAEAIRTRVENIKEKIGGFIGKIKEFFNIGDGLTPKIPLPHFKITPEGWRFRDLFEGIKPSLSVEWYAKGGIFNGAQVIGVGERGPEAVLPLNARGLEPFAAALKEAGGGGDTYIVNGITYDDGTNIANAVQDLMRAARINRRANGYV